MIWFSLRHITESVYVFVCVWRIFLLDLLDLRDWWLLVYDPCWDLKAGS